MPTCYKVELIAHAYESPVTGRLDKGWRGEFIQGDPKFEHFRNNPSFKVTSRYVPDMAPPAKEPEKKPTPQQPHADGTKDTGNKEDADATSGEDIDDSDLTEVTVAELGLNLPAETIANLTEAGFGTADAIAAASVDQLDAVKGVGLSTAERLIEEAQKALGE